MRSLRVTGVVTAALLAASCVAFTPPKPPPVDARVKALADTYLNGYFERNPEQITYYGIAGRRHDRLTDNSLGAIKAWQAKEDVWIADAKGIDPEVIGGEPLRATYAIVRETLEGSIGSRMCRNALWGVNQISGWQVSLGYLVTIQPGREGRHCGGGQSRRRGVLRRDGPAVQHAADSTERGPRARAEADGRHHGTWWSSP